ncbi:MAG: glycerate kinase [Chitinophagales bacterium]
MHILIAPNAFKNSLDALKAAECIRVGLQKSGLAFNSTLFPVGDGGDGTAFLLEQRLGASAISLKVDDPLGRKIDSSFGWLEKSKTAIVELANASGLRLLKPSEYDPLHANTRGTGETILSALDQGAIKIVLCIGGSATIDGAAGILAALGIRFLNGGRSRIFELPRQLDLLASVDISSLDRRLGNTEIVVLCDVKNQLLGEEGAAKIFGPQKGAGPSEILILESCLAQLARITQVQTGIDMRTLQFGGAAGGVAAGLAGYLGANLVNGIDYFLDSTGFDEELEKADLVITGEGMLDLQTLQGKAPYGVAVHAKKKLIPVIAFAGMIEQDDRQALSAYFDELIEINSRPIDLEYAIKNASLNLEQAAMYIGIELAKRN